MVLQREFVFAYASLLGALHLRGHSDFNSWLHIFLALLGSINMELISQGQVSNIPLPCVNDDKFPRR